MDSFLLDFETSQLVLQEVQRRVSDIPDFVDPSFPHQAEFIIAEERWLALFGTRRMAKTESLCRRFLRTGFMQARSPMLYISLTKDQARRIFWNGCLKPLLEKFGILDQVRLHDQRMEVYFPNGSILYILGMDADENQMKKLLGGKYKGVGIDEAGSFKVNLETMYRAKLRPALIDLGGWCVFAGTPEQLAAGFFFQITRDDETPRLSGWKVFEWTGYENPYVRRQWDDEIKELLAENPEIEHTPDFERNYRKKWRKDNAILCYKTQASTFINELPAGEYYYGLGVDLGYSDATAFTVIAVKDGTRKAFIVYQYKMEGMILHAVDEHIRMLQKLFFFVSYIVDGANKQAVETFIQYFEIPFESAQKQGKADAIELLNSAIIMLEFFIVGRGTNLELEWKDLIWDVDELPIKVEDPRCENHQSDATLYIWRKMLMMYYQNRPLDKPKKTDEDQVDDWERKKSSEVERRKKRRRFGGRSDEYDDEWDEDDESQYA